MIAKRMKAVREMTTTRTRSSRIRTGIATARGVGVRVGRPRGPRDRVRAAARLRDGGASWSQIAAKLGVCRTRARQLVEQANRNGATK